MSRAKLLQVLLSDTELRAVAGGLDFPVIIRPRGSHAGVGLAKIDDVFALGKYLIEQKGEDFFLARYVDYSSEDGLFRKYRVVDRRRQALCLPHGDRRPVEHLVPQRRHVGKREQAAGGSDLHADLRHRLRAAPPLHAAGLSDRIGLDYFIIDCAETKAGDLLIFEADNTAVVHNMDTPELYPYKPPQMHKIFDAFAGMLRAATRPRERRGVIPVAINL